jgi:serine/threonine protein kinase
MTGRVIAGRYNLQHPIGRGAMGVVWRARDQLLDRDVAVKEVVISALIGADERRNAYQRTLREARTAARLSHRGVVAVYDVAEEDGRPWIVMELVPSQSLDQVLVVEGRLPPARAGRIGQQVLSALAAAHAAGVLHRDVKPSNVLIATNKTGEGWDERAVLTDFGIAQFEGDPRLTQTGMVMGSPGFTAPERIRGSDATPASDLWSLGATIYAAVEGRGPYENRGGAITTMTAIINEDAPIAPHAGRLATVIAALLRRDPSVRPSAAAAARMFAQALPHLSEATEEPPPAPHTPTIRSSYIPVPAAPVASASLTAADDARPDDGPDGKPARAADAQPAAKAPAEEQQTQEAPESPSADEADEAVSAASADSAGQAASAAAADAESGSEPEAAAEAVSEPEDEDEPGPEAEADAEAEPEEQAEDEARLAGETKKIKVPAAEVVEAPSVDAAVADHRAAAAALLDAQPAGDEPGSLAADTVIPGKGPGRYQPTQLSVPVARVAPSAPVMPPSTAQPKSPEPKPAPPKPTFTAAKPANRAAPTFSTANPASPARPASPGRPTPARPVTPPDQRPAYGPASAGQGYSPPKKGGTTPFPPSGAQYAPQGGPPAGQYPGPSQSYPDLSRQYAPGTGGGRAGRGLRGRKWQVIWLAAAVIVAAGIGTAVALSQHGNTGSLGNPPTTIPSVADTTTTFQSVNALNNPSTTLPAADWSTQTVTAAEARSTAAGFSIDVPPGWSEKPNGLATDFIGPGNLFVEVDLTQQSTSNMLTAARQVKAGTHLRDYKQISLVAVPVRHTEGAVWKFNWTPAGGVQFTADDIFFAQSTSAGVQDYAVYIRSPTSAFGSSLSVFDKMLRTFQTVPAS